MAKRRGMTAPTLLVVSGGVWWYLPWKSSAPLSDNGCTQEAQRKLHLSVMLEELNDGCRRLLVES